MKTFFLVLLTVSLMATGAAFYWKTYYPERGSGHANFTATSKDKSTSRSALRRRHSEWAKTRRPSRRQDNMFNMGLATSVFSMLGTLLSIFFAYRADRRAARAEKGE